MTSIFFENSFVTFVLFVEKFLPKARRPWDGRLRA